MEAIAKHDFTATAEDELSFRRSQVLKVRLVISFCDIPLFLYIFRDPQEFPPSRPRFSDDVRSRVPRPLPLPLPLLHPSPTFQACSFKFFFPFLFAFFVLRDFVFTRENFHCTHGVRRSLFTFLYRLDKRLDYSVFFPKFPL